jgi:protein-S-isoprenylcysteine O-methyltransferase Ste14
VNYFGDLVLFTGLALLSGVWFTLTIPALMLLGFVLFNVPVLDAYLHDKYGSAFDEYARRTRTLIPGVY